MKRLWPLLTLLLAGCGTLNTAPTAGQLLDAHTTLNVAGNPVKADAYPTLSRNTFSVKVRLSTTKTTLPGLTVTDMYVVTNDGVWVADGAPSRTWKCAANCAVAHARGAANGVQTGAGVQVILGLQDAQGHQYLLRDPQAQVK